MNLPSPPKEYDAGDQTKVRDAVRRADDENHKRGRDVEVGKGRLVLTDTVTGQRYSLTIASGIVMVAPL